MVQWCQIARQQKLRVEQARVIKLLSFVTTIVHPHPRTLFPALQQCMAMVKSNAQPPTLLISVLPLKPKGYLRLIYQCN